MQGRDGGRRWSYLAPQHDSGDVLLPVTANLLDRRVQLQKVHIERFRDESEQRSLQVPRRLTLRANTYHPRPRDGRCELRAPIRIGQQHLGQPINQQQLTNQGRVGELRVAER